MKTTNTSTTAVYVTICFFVGQMTLRSSARTSRRYLRMRLKTFGRLAVSVFDAFLLPVGAASTAVVSTTVPAGRVVRADRLPVGFATVPSGSSLTIHPLRQLHRGQGRQDSNLRPAV